MDLNADLGEFTTTDELDLELKLLEIVTSCNIACGGHIGDEEVSQRLFLLLKIRV